MTEEITCSLHLVKTSLLAVSVRYSVNSVRSLEVMLITKEYLLERKFVTFYSGQVHDGINLKFAHGFIIFTLHISESVQ